jgi:importin-9
MVKDQYTDAVNEATTSILPVWLEAFKVLLNVDEFQGMIGASNWDNLLVRIQIFKVILIISSASIA